MPCRPRHEQAGQHQEGQSQASQQPHTHYGPQCPPYPERAARRRALSLSSIYNTPAQRETHLGRLLNLEQHLKALCPQSSRVQARGTAALLLTRLEDLPDASVLEPENSDASDDFGDGASQPPQVNSSSGRQAETVSDSQGRPPRIITVLEEALAQTLLAQDVAILASSALPAIFLSSPPSTAFPLATFPLATFPPAKAHSAPTPLKEASPRPASTPPTPSTSPFPRPPLRPRPASISHSRPSSLVPALSNVILSTSSPIDSSSPSPSPIATPSSGPTTNKPHLHTTLRPLLYPILNHYSLISTALSAQLSRITAAESRRQRSHAVTRERRALLEGRTRMRARMRLQPWTQIQTQKWTGVVGGGGGWECYSDGGGNNGNGNNIGTVGGLGDGSGSGNGSGSDMGRATGKWGTGWERREGIANWQQQWRRRRWSGGGGVVDGCDFHGYVNADARDWVGEDVGEDMGVDEHGGNQPLARQGDILSEHIYFHTDVHSLTQSHSLAHRRAAQPTSIDHARMRQDTQYVDDANLPQHHYEDEGEGYDEGWEGWEGWELGEEEEAELRRELHELVRNEKVKRKNYRRRQRREEKGTGSYRY